MHDHAPAGVGGAYGDMESRRGRHTLASGRLLGEQDQVPKYGLPLFASVVGRLPRVHPPVRSVRRRPSCADATVRMGLFWAGCLTLGREGVA